ASTPELSGLPSRSAIVTYRLVFFLDLPRRGGEITWNPAVTGPFWHSVGMGRRRGMWWPIVLAAVLALATGCAARTAEHDSDWRELTLPQRDARILEFAPTADGVLALGSIPAADGRAPAAWTSTDGTHWKPVPVHGESAYA